MRTHASLISKLKAKRILVTGGAGFIGSHIVDLLLEQGKQVHVLDNLSSGRLANLETAQESPNFHFFQGDLLDFKDTSRALEGCELVFHLAANPQVRTGITNPELHFQQNVVTTFQLLEVIRQTKTVKGLVFTSSSTIYGDAQLLPTPEDYGPIKPMSMYGAAKLASEGLISSYAHTHGFRAVICRLANIIGPRAKIGVVRDFIDKLHKTPNRLEILGDGTQTKSYLYVSECIECLILCYALTQRQVEIFNVGSEDRTSVKEIAQIVTEVMGLADVELQYSGGVDGGRGWKGDVKQMLLDISRLKELGWNPRYTSAQAVRATAEAFLEEFSTIYDSGL